jgi:hypothetical protein
MLKAAANAPNDPKMSGAARAPEGTDSPTPDGEDFGGEAAAGDAAAAEAGGMADVAEVALIAL